MQINYELTQVAILAIFSHKKSLIVYTVIVEALFYFL